MGVAGSADTAGRARTREAIGDAALAIIKRQGLSALSMRAIAQQLGVSAMMPYTYYDGKDELLLDLRLRLLREFAAHLTAQLSATAPVERLREVCRMYLAYSRMRPDEFRLMFEAWSFDDLRALRSKYPAAHFRSDALWSVMRRCVAECRDREEDAITERLTHIMWFHLHGLASLHLARKLVFGLTVEDIEESVLDAIEAIVRAGV